MTYRHRLFLALFLLLTIVLAGMFGGPANTFEQTIMAGAVGLRSNMPALARAAGYMTVLGGMPLLMTVAIIAALYLMTQRRGGLTLLLIATVAAERLLVEILKDWVGRPRPFLEHLPSSLAFPSGHSANSMTTYLAVALFAVPARYRRPAIAAAVSLSVLIGLTRLVLGVHWPSDVIGGWAFGLMAVSIAVTAGERSGLLLEAKHDVIGRHLPPPEQEEAA